MRVEENADGSLTLATTDANAYEGARRARVVQIVRTSKDGVAIERE